MIIQQFSDGYTRVNGCTPSQRRALLSYLLRTKQWIDVVPGISSVTVVHSDEMTSAKAYSLLEMAIHECAEISKTPRTPITLPISYGGADGPNLEHLATKLGVPEREIIRRHEACLYNVEIMGFTPGFAYLSGFENDWAIKRLSVPAKEIPAGSVGIIGKQCGIYGLSGPGGWPIIGRADATFFDPELENPFLLHTDMQISFQGV